MYFGSAVLGLLQQLVNHDRNFENIVFPPSQIVVVLLFSVSVGLTVSAGRAVLVFPESNTRAALVDKGCVIVASRSYANVTTTITPYSKELLEMGRAG